MSFFRKTGFLFLLIIAVPVLVFTVFEVGNLKHYEGVIWKIYKNQLDALLYSVNQYSEEVLSGWAGKIEKIAENKHDEKVNLEKLINEMPSVTRLYQYSNDLSLKMTVPENRAGKLKEPEVRNLLSENDTLLKKLTAYMEGGYRKMVPVQTKHPRIQLILFLSKSKKELTWNVLVLDPETFISEVLDPKIQEIAGGKFHIAAFRNGEKKYIYSSEKIYIPGKIVENKPFWLIIDYTLGIELKEKTIADLSSERADRNLLIIVLMDIILILGAWLIYRNIKKQVELTRLKSDFISNVSHEIRTPLALVSMYIETLEMGRIKDPAKIQEYYSIIFGETQRLSSMVNRILSFSNIENKKRKYNFDNVQINEVLKNSILTFRYNIENKGFDFSDNLDPNIPEIFADKDALAESFINLIDNAMKYSEERKEITVRTGQKGNHVYFEVEDKGIGIAEKDQKFIFDQFYRVAEKNLAYRVKGYGLGLTIVKHIMDAHKGKIEVMSTPGSGTVIRLLFPLKPE